MKPLYCLFLLAPMAYADTTIAVDLATRKTIGESTAFDRSKYITIHSSTSERDWKGDYDKLRYMTHDLDVSFARETGRITWELGQLKEDPKNPGHVDFANMEKRGKQARQWYAQNPEHKKFEKWDDLVIAAQVHPFWPNGEQIHPPGAEPWALVSPKATAQYMVYWLNMFTGGEGHPRPDYLEVMNEPLYELLKPGSGVTPEKVFKYHNEVARFIKTLNSDIKLGGYTTAFPDLEKNDFSQWHERWKAFIDMTPESIDFHSLHLYDFPGIHHGKQQYRKGAHMEGTLDLIENYSLIKNGRVKPFLISEYGSQLNDWYDQPWSVYRDWLCLKAINSMMMQFMERPDTILKTIPFITAKAEWGYGYNNSQVPYYWRLLRKENEPESYTGDWVFTEQVKFYQLWDNVRGERVQVESSDQDLLVDCYVDGKIGWVIVNNLVQKPQPFELQLDSLGDVKVEKLIAKHLYYHDGKVRYDYTPKDAETRTFTLGSESTMILEFVISDPVPAEKTVAKHKHFADKVVQPIGAGQPLDFTIKDISTEAVESATLRLGVGRAHGKSLAPSIRVNGTPLESIPGIKGPDQRERNSVFGVYEIPVPVELLKGETAVSVSFPDSGGHISSVALELYSVKK